MLPNCLHCKLSIYQILVGRPCGQFSGFFQNILKQIKTVLLKDQIFFPGILLVITGTMAVMVSRSVSLNCGWITLAISSGV